MIRYAAILVFVFHFSSAMMAQDNQCNCLDNLNQLIAKTEENYAGFPTKVNPQTKGNYQKLIKSLRKKSAAINQPKACFFLLKTYVRFFQDKHFILNYTNEKDYDTETATYSESYFKNAAAKNKLTQLEGIWQNPDSSLVLAIRKFSQKTYKAIVVRSNDGKIPVGLVYFTFVATPNGYIVKPYDYFITTDIPAKQKGNLLQIWNQYMFGMVYPKQMSIAEQEELNTWRDNNNGLAFKKLSAKTAWLKIPTFYNNDDKIQALVADNDATIKSCENLIVDLTGNGGGNTGWVFFLPYFMTNPMVQYDTYLRVTPENVKSKLADLEPFALHPIPGEYQKYFPDDILAAYKKAYQELPTTTKPFYPIPGVTFPLDSILKQPKRIALVVDDFCGSSSEYFFFLARQSKKTTTYGIPTIGMMDYEGMSIPTALPYERYILTIPITKSHWTDTDPIDQKGFKPEKNLKNIDQKNWIDYILKDLEKE